MGGSAAGVDSEQRTTTTHLDGGRRRVENVQQPKTELGVSIDPYICSTVAADENGQPGGCCGKARVQRQDTVCTQCSKCSIPR